MTKTTPEYVRVYQSVVDDPKFATIYDDDHHFATWVRLLMAADSTWPASCPIPFGTRKASLNALSEAGIIDLGTGHRFRIRGLDAERERRAEAGRVGGLASGVRRAAVQRPLNDRATTVATTVEPAETRRVRAENEPSAPDPWDDPEHEAMVWLSRHGCDLRPGNGYHQKLVTAVERHGVKPIVGMMDRLAAAGTKNGDIKGFLFGAIDALDARSRPNLAVLEKEERAEAAAESFAERAARTRERTTAIREAIEGAKP
jgi:hypothetical protein